MRLARGLVSAAPRSDDEPGVGPNGGDPLDLADLVAAGRRHDVARATARVRATIRTHESVAHAAACQVRMVFRFTAVIAITDTHLYAAFARPVAGTHAIRLSALQDISMARCTRRGHRHLLVRGQRRRWRFLEVEPAGRAAQIAEHLRTHRQDPAATRPERAGQRST